jgi:hypothetical protein
MTKYIKGKDGKFAGSIGNGKHRVPTSPQRIERAATQELPSIDIATVMNANTVINYTLNDENRPSIILPSTPQGIDRSELPTPPAQRDFENLLLRYVDYVELFIEEEKEMRAGFIESLDTNEYDIDQLSAIWDRGKSHSLWIITKSVLDSEIMAQQLRKQGHHNQAYAFEYFSHAAQLIHSEGTLSEWYLQKFDEPAHWNVAHSEKPIDFSVRITAKDTERYQEQCIRKCEQAVFTAAFKNDVRALAKGAVVLDYIKILGNNDPDTAATMIALLPNPYSNRL